MLSGFTPRPLKRLFTANQCWTSFLDAGGLRDIEVEAVTRMLACGTRIPAYNQSTCTTNLKIEVSVQFLIPTGFVTQKITDLWIQFSSTAGPDGKQVISVREESLSGCYRRNSHGTPGR